MLFRSSLIVAALAISTAAQAHPDVRVNFTEAVAAVFPDYGPAQVEAISWNAWVESRYQPCVVSAKGDEGLFQWRGPRRRALHRFSGVPMGNCVPTLTQVRFMRQEWESMGRAHGAFMRAQNQHQAYRILRTVYGKSLPLSRS